VKAIGEKAFKGCTGLTSIIIPNSVDSIGKSAFAGCTGLTSVTIGNSAASIGDYAFSGCTGLMSTELNPADADFCLDLKSSPGLVLLRRYNEPETPRTKPGECRDYSGMGKSAKIEFVYKSGKRITFSSGYSSGFGSGTVCGNFDAEGWAEYEEEMNRFRDTVTHTVKPDVPEQFFVWIFQKDKEDKDLYKELSQLKDKIIDGYMEVSLDCNRRKLEYKIKFSARITGECGCDSIKEKRK
jgi:hypothetical protein